MLALTSMSLDDELDPSQLQVLLLGGGSLATTKKNRKASSTTDEPSSHQHPQEDPSSSSSSSPSSPVESFPERPSELDHPWLSNAAWQRIVALSDILKENAFLDVDFHEFFREYIDEWRIVFDEDDPTTIEWPDDIDQSLTELERCLVIQALRPDCLVRCLRNLIGDKLGSSFLDPPAFDLHFSFKLATPSRPLIFVLSAGADPMNVLLKLAKFHRMEHQLVSISLGQGQGPKAVAGKTWRFAPPWSSSLHFFGIISSCTPRCTEREASCREKEKKTDREKEKERDTIRSALRVKQAEDTRG